MLCRLKGEKRFDPITGHPSGKRLGGGKEPSVVALGARNKLAMLDVRKGSCKTL